MKATNPQLLTPIEALNQSFDMPESMYAFGNTNNGTTPYQFSGILQTDTAVKSLIKRQGFRIGELNLMIRYEDGNELSEMPDVFPVPNAPHWFLGFSNLHGLIIPVFDLKKYFGFSEVPHITHNTLNKSNDSAKHPVKISATHDVIDTNDDSIANQILNTKYSDITGKSNRPMLLVIQHNNNATGVVIDGLLERLEYEESCIQNTGLKPSQIESAINGSYLINDEIWFDIDSLAFLNELETSLV